MCPPGAQLQPPRRRAARGVPRRAARLVCVVHRLCCLTPGRLSASPERQTVEPIDTVRAAAAASRRRVSRVRERGCALLGQRLSLTLRSGCGASGRRRQLFGAEAPARRGGRRGGGCEARAPPTRAAGTGRAVRETTQRCVRGAARCRAGARGASRLGPAHHFWPARLGCTARAGRRLPRASAVR